MMDFNIVATIDSEWKKIDKAIQLHDICIIGPLGQQFLCGCKIPFEQFEYLYFGCLDSRYKAFAVQTKISGHNFIRVLDKKPEKIFALRVFKKAMQNES